MKVEFSFYDGQLRETYTTLLIYQINKYFKELYIFYISDFVSLNTWGET